MGIGMIPGLPPIPTGDPGAVRSVAARLRSLSQSLGAQSINVDRVIDGVRYEGPAATEMRTRVKDHRAAVALTSIEIHEASEELERVAARLEEEIAGWHRLKLRLEDAAKEAAEALDALKDMT